MKAIRFIFISLLTFCGIIYLLYISYVYLNQSEMVFIATKLPKDYKFEFNQKFEEITIPSFDGKLQNGLLFRTAEPKGLIFYLHGNAGAIDSWGNNAAIYTDLGYDIFFLDYRGYGKSEGEIDDEEQVCKDISIVYDKVASQYKDKKITILGYSIGTGLATYLASVKNPEKLILQSPFYNFTEFSSGKVPYFPNFLKKFKFETNKNILKVKSHIYIFHGDADNLISIDNSFKLEKLLKPTDQFFILKGEDHIGINGNEDFQIKLREILK